MKFKLIFTTIALAVLLQSPLFAQYNIAEIGVAQGQFKVNELGLKSNLIGLHLGIEAPLSTWSFRFGLDYLTRIGAADSLSGNLLNSLTSIKLLGGKVFNEGHRVQFPLLVGGFFMTPDGGLKFKDDKKTVYGVSTSAGLRVYISNRFSIFGEALYDVGILPKYTYNNSSGAQVTSNVPLNNLAFSVGIAFVYRNKTAKK